MPRRVEPKSELVFRAAKARARFRHTRPRATLWPNRAPVRELGPRTRCTDRGVDRRSGSTSTGSHADLRATEFPCCTDAANRGPPFRGTRPVHLTATTAVATMGDAKVFRSGREFAAFIGLVPKQSGSGGKVNLLGISKRGDTYLRTLLIHGARSVLAHEKESGSWVEQIRKRRPPNVVTVALANKMARMIWAVLAHERRYEKGYVSAKAT